MCRYIIGQYLFPVCSANKLMHNFELISPLTFFLDCSTHFSCLITKETNPDFTAKMRKRYDRLKQKFRSRDDNAESTNTRPSSEPAASTTQTPNASSQLLGSPDNSAGSSGATLTTPLIQEPPASALSLQVATHDQATCLSLSEQLWTEAYNGLKEKESDLVKAYENILSKVQAEWTETTTPSEVNNMPHCKNKEARHMWMMVYAGLERTKRQAEVKETASDLMELTNNIKSSIDKIVKYSAEATVVWVGLSLGLEILSNPMKEPGLNRKAITYVMSCMRWYWNLADVALGQDKASPSDTLRDNLKGHLVDFFKKLLTLQMKSVCLYYRNWASIILRDMVKLDDWNGKLNELKNAEAAIARDIQQYNSEDVKIEVAGIAKNSRMQAESLENIYTAIREEARLREKKEQNDEDRDCLRALHVTDPRLDKQRIQIQKRGLQPELCDWIFTSTAYEQFMADNSKRILWINGLPGKGKTMLACGIIDGLRRSLRPLAFFFCEGSAAKDNLSGETAVIRGLIYMLLDYQPSLMSIMRPHYDKMGEKLFHNHNSSIILVQILTEMLQDPCLHEAIVVIDALDECSGRSSLIDVINDLSQSCPAQWILTSRPWPEIKTELSGAQGIISLSLEDEKESVSKAVKSYIDTTVDRLVKRWGDDADLKTTIAEYMYSQAGNTFLWVSLVCKRLASSRISKRCVMDVLKSLPDTLDKLYDEMLVRIVDSVEKDRLIQILATVCISYRPLTPAELATLMDDTKEDDVADAIDWCGSFLDCQNDGIFLVHQSAREFLVNKNPSKIFPKGLEFQHHSVFLKSLEALSTLLKRDIYQLGNPGLSSAQISTPDPDLLAPIRYSCVYWVDHLKSSKLQYETGDHELGDDGLVHRFFRTKYLNWLEALSILCRLSEGILAVHKLEALAADMESIGLAKLLLDARRFVLTHKMLIEVTPLQVYASALVFSPTESLIRQLYESETSIHIVPPNTAGLDWTACLQTVEDNAHSVCFSSDGLWLASGSCDVRVWSTSTGACLRVLEGHQEKVGVVVFSPNNLVLASGSFDNTVRLWDPMRSGCTTVLYGHDRNVVSLSFSSDSLTVASGSDDGTIKIWSVATGDCFRTILNNASTPIFSLAFLSGNGTLVSVYESSIDVWDLSTGSLKRRVDPDVVEYGVPAFSSESSQILIPSPFHLEIWNLVTDERSHLTYRHDTDSPEALAPDGKRRATGYSNGSIDIWDIQTGHVLQTLEGHTDDVSSLAFTLKGTQLASGSLDGTIKIWNLDDSPNLPTRHAPGSLQGMLKICNLDFSPIIPTRSRQKDSSRGVDYIKISSNDIVLSADIDISVVKVWDRNTGACLRAFQTRLAQAQNRSMIPKFPLSSDGKRLALVSSDGYFSIWNVSTGTQAQIFKKEHGEITYAAFSLDDALLVSGSDDGSIRVWDPVTGACLKTFDGRGNGRVEFLAIAPDNMRIAAIFAGSSVGIWDVTNDLFQSPIDERSLPDLTIFSMAWSCDSKRLAIGSKSGHTYIFPGLDGSKRQTLRFDSGDVQALAFSPDNTMLALASFWDEVKVWDISREDYLCTLAGFTTQLAWDPNNDSRLQTEFGDFDIPHFPTERDGREPVTEPIPVGLGISSDHSWILRQGISILWLPHEYRPCHPPSIAPVQENDVFMRTESGKFCWLRFPSL
ncbi:hypothetical protein NW768_000957 [Fusarium equiseti]|uniref:NACHT domain-containing protein n=1 Tax=Fusarium equiseti TaxID=61235 RepID=A0ABQ8RUC5_FUSEQ|nr:hypothetical protein NW768_000957 [Fusarium equiseti]